MKVFRGKVCVRLVVGLAAAFAVQAVAARRAVAVFAEFESGQVRPLALSLDGSKLFAVNTPDNQLEIFDVSGGNLTHSGSVPVGLEPVAVAVRTDTEVWVVNHLSDSISIIDLGSSPPRVVRTLLVGDEPRDIVFAGPTDVDGHFKRAFITTARRGQNMPVTVPTDATVPSTPRALVFVFDATNLGATMEGVPDDVLELFGDTPRALATNAAGTIVYAAVFHSGNQTACVSEGAVCNGGNGAGSCSTEDGTVVPGGPLDGSVPGGLPLPNQNFQGTPAPEVGLIVKYNESNGHWEDQVPRNWTNAIRFTLPDLDVFQINAATLVTTADFAHVGTVLFNMLVNPSNGKVYVTNTDAKNEVRFEGPGNSASTVRGHLQEARITVLDGTNVLPRHLNKHISSQTMGYKTNPMPLGVKDDSLATPVGMALSSTGTLYVAAFGSSAIGKFTSSQIENDTFTPSAASHIAVTGGGPTGLVLDEADNRLFVLTRFDNSVKAIDTTTNMEVAGHALHNPEPAVITDGRRFLYDAHLTSSNGEASCSSCHIFADFDSLGWDLGNPDDIVRTNPNPIGPIGSSQNFHPMKGPMTTQTLRGLANEGPMHWRGDRTGGYVGQALNEQLAFEAFNVAFAGLLGRDEGQLSASDMTKFAQFILEVKLPPNPNRQLTNALRSPQETNGQNIFLTRNAVDLVSTCEGCHQLDASQGFFGTGGETTFENETQEFKVAHLRNAYQKIGMFGMPDVPFIDTPPDTAFQGDQVRGFGFLHDGSISTVFDFLHASVFPSLTNADRADLEQYVLSFDTTYAPMVGQQVTLNGTNGAALNMRINNMITRAMTNFTLVGQPGSKECDLVVKGTVGGIARSYLMNGATGQFQPDRVGEGTLSDGGPTGLRAKASVAGQELTYTCVPPGSGTRIGLDRDEDGFYDRDELDVGKDPADPNSFPGSTTDELVAGKKLLIKNKLPDDAAKNKIVLQSKDVAVTPPAGGSGDDPTCGIDPSGTVKATLDLSSTGGQSFSADLPCQNWSVLGGGTGFQYLDSDLSEGAVKKVVWKAGQMKAILLGKGPTTLAFDLQVGVDQGLVSSILTSGDRRVCMRCDDSDGKDGSDGKKFLGKGASCPAPPACI